jgi:alkylresorcinol/alkylpyrone synthase
MAATKSTIASIALASPPYAMDQNEVEASIRKHYAHRLSARSLDVVGKIFNHPSILRRRFAFDEPEDLVDEPPDHRIARFTHWAVELAARAVRDALDRVKLKIDDVSALVVNTCTG